MGNKRGRYVNLKKLSSYVEKCFKDACVTEEIEYNPEEIMMEYVLVQDNDDVFHFFSLFDCNYIRVLRRVNYRLRNNLEKNFGVCYKNDDGNCNFRCYFEVSDNIAPHHTKAAFNTKKGIVYLNLWSENDVTGVTTKLGFLATAERLTIAYFNISEEEYRDLKWSSECYALPKEILNDWKRFRELWDKAIGEEICPYKILCSKGVNRL